MNYLRTFTLRGVLCFSAALLSLSCLRSEPGGAAAPLEKALTIEATLGEGTRTVNDFRQTYWAAGDEISVIHTPENALEFSASRFYYSGSDGAFSGSVTNLAPVNNWYLIYPYSEGNTDPRQVSVTVPTLQYQEGNGSTAHLSGEGFPLSGKSLSVPGEENISIHMRQVLVAVHFSLTNTSSSPIVVKEIAISAPSAIGGSFVGDITKEKAEWTACDGASSTITLQVNDGQEIPAGGSASFYAGALPFTAPALSRIKVKVCAVHPAAPETEIPFYRIIDLSEETSFKAGTFKKINLSFDELHQDDGSVPEATYNLENDAIALYLDAASDRYTVSNRSTFTVVTNYAVNVSSSNRLDWPKPVTVSWTNPGGVGNSKTVVVYNDYAMSDEELRVSVSGSTVMSADIYNLIPGRTYYYRVISGEKLIKSGCFATTGRRRMMKVGSDYGQNYANNCRDFGGQQTISGKTIRYGKLFRGSNMDKTSAEAKDVLLNYMNIGLDVDLRTVRPSGSAGYYFEKANILNDALGLGDIAGDDLDTYRGHTIERYNSWDELTTVSRMKATITRIIKAAINDTGVYIHCKVGADRTGYVCMMLQAILGVPEEKCDLDYEMTSFSTVGTRTRTGVNNYYYLQGLDFISRQEGDTFQEKAVDYVVNTLGISLDLVEQFQNVMLE